MVDGMDMGVVNGGGAVVGLVLNEESQFSKTVVIAPESVIWLAYAYDIAEKLIK